jgi:hypothetical protein
MVQPINYAMDVLSPVEGYLQGLKFGEGLLTARQGREATALGMEETRQVMGIREQQEARAQQEFAARQAEAQRQQAQAAAMQEQLMGLRQAAIDGTLTPEALNQFAVANASTFDEFRTAFQGMSEPKRQADTAFAIQLSTSLLRGSPDVALDLIDTRIAAAENAGTPALLQEAQRLRAIRAEAEMDPVGFATANLANLAAQGAIDSTTMKAVLDSAGQKAKPVEGASPIGKIAQDVEAGLIPRSVLEAQIRVDERAGDEGLTLQQRIAEEARLRGEYVKRTEDLSAAERNFTVIQTSAQDNSGAGDIALVTSFMKMLDPGSVVRETEFATAANAGGLLARLSTIAQQVESGQFLTPQQRADFQRLAGQYLQAAEEQEGRVQDSYRLLVENYGLNPVNVFGARAVTAPGAGDTTPSDAMTPPPAAPTSTGDDAKATFMADPRVQRLTEEQREAAWEIYQEQVGR